MIQISSPVIIVGGDFNLVLNVDKDKKVVLPGPIQNRWKW